MKDTTENYPSSRQSVRPSTTNDRPTTTRHSETRPLTSEYSNKVCREICFILNVYALNLIAHKIREVNDYLFALFRISDVARQTPTADRPGMRLTSLSALYQPAFKPYSFSHMYNTKYNADFEGRYLPPPLPIR